MLNTGTSVNAANGWMSPTINLSDSSNGPFSLNAAAVLQERQTLNSSQRLPDYTNPASSLDTTSLLPNGLFTQSVYDLNSFNISFSANHIFNSSEVQTTESLVLSDSAKAGLIVLYSLTTLLSISGNVLVVMVFTRGRRCRTDIRPFLVNLAVADLIMAIFCIPFTFTLVMMKTWVFSKPMCPIVLFLQHLSVSASVFTNMAIGLDRFLVVMYPLRSRVTKDRAKYVLLAIWLCAMTLSSVQLVVGRAIEQPGDRAGDVRLNCDEIWLTHRARRTFTLFVLFITYIIPLIILAVAYSIVGTLLWRRTTPGNADQTRDLHQLQAKKKVVKMLVLVVTMFGVCWLPLHTFFLVIDFNENLTKYKSLTDERFFVALYYSVHWLAMSNSFANPVIYSFTNESFRADLAYVFYMLFPFCKCLKQMATRQLSVSIRDNRFNGTLRRSPCDSPCMGNSGHYSHKRRRLYNGRRLYLALGPDLSLMEERARNSHNGKRGPYCYSTAMNAAESKITSTYV